MAAGQRDTRKSRLQARSRALLITEIQGLERLYDDAGGHVGVVDDFGYEYPPADELPDPPDPLARRTP